MIYSLNVLKKDYNILLLEMDRVIAICKKDRYKCEENNNAIIELDFRLKDLDMSIKVLTDLTSNKKPWTPNVREVDKK